MDGTLIDRPIARILLVLVCLYAPYAWLVLIDYPWDSYRWLWIKMWLVLPGILVHFSQTIHLLPDWSGFIIMGAVTCGIVALSTVQAARSKRFLNANLPSLSEQAITRAEVSTYGLRAGPLAELLRSGLNRPAARSIRYAEA